MPIAASYIAPHPGHAAKASGRMMEANRRRSRIEGTGVGADHTLAQHCHLQALVADVVLDHLRHRPVETAPRALRDLCRCALRSAHATATLQSRRRFRPPDEAHSADGGSRRTLHPSLSHRRGKACEPRRRSVRPSSQSWMLDPSRKGTKRPFYRRGPLEAAPREIQLVHHQRVQQNRRDRRKGTCVRSEGLLDGAGAADAQPAFDNQHLLSGFRKIGGTGEAVVARANDDHIPGGRGQFADRHRKSDFSQNCRCR